MVKNNKKANGKRKAKRPATQFVTTKSSKQSAPLARGYGLTRSPPKSNFRMRFHETIEIIDIAATGWEVKNRFRINAGNGDTFPWLSKIARQFEHYKFHTLAFKLVPRNPATTAGMVSMFVDYDSQDAAPVTYQQASANETYTERNMWTPIIVKCVRKMGRELVMVVNGEDYKNRGREWCDLGMLNIASDSTDAGSFSLEAMGEVEFISQQNQFYQAGYALEGAPTVLLTPATNMEVHSTGAIAAPSPVAGTIDILTNEAAEMIIEFIGTGLGNIGTSGTATDTLLAVTNAGGTNAVGRSFIPAGSKGKSIKPIIDAATTVTTFRLLMQEIAPALAAFAS